MSFNADIFHRLCYIFSSGLFFDFSVGVAVSSAIFIMDRSDNMNSEEEQSVM